jgi:hypothetical protein
MRCAVWMFALMSCLAGACSTKDSNTKLMVVVWSDLTVPSELNEIRIEIHGPSTSPSHGFPLSAVATPGKSPLPVVYQLVSPDDKAVAFDVAAVGYVNASPVVSQSANVTFVPGHTRVLTLFLARACEQVPCANDKTCSGGICVDINVGDLPEYNPQLPWVAPDAGGAGRGDAGAEVRSFEVGPDTAGDTAHSLDAADGPEAVDGSDTGPMPVKDAGADTLPDILALPVDLADVLPDVPSDPVASSDPVVHSDLVPGLDALDTASPPETGRDLALLDVAPDLVVPDVPADSATTEVSLDGVLGGCNASSNTQTDPANCGRCGNVCTSKVCRESTCLATALYGNTGAGVSNVNFAGNYLAGVQVYVPNASVITGLGVVLLSATTSRNMYLGLYSDEAGNPAKLIATLAGPVAVSAGGQEFDVSPAPVDIAKGNYWILGVWDGTASFASNTGTTVTWRNVSRPMGPLPQTAPTSMGSIQYPPPNLFIKVAQ